MHYDCRWVPGTLDRVVVKQDGVPSEWSLAEVARRLGRQAVADLYLTGRASAQLAPEGAKAALRPPEIGAPPLALPLRSLPTRPPHVPSPARPGRSGR